MCYANALFKNSPSQIHNLHSDWVFPALYILLVKAESIYNDRANVWPFFFKYPIIYKFIWKSKPGM